MNRKPPYQNLFLFYGALCSAVLLINISVTLLNPTGSISNLDGIIGKIDHGTLWNTLDPISNLFYTIGYYCCHQEGARSLSLNGNQMPICIREIFLLLGMAVGFLILSTHTVLPAKERFILCTVLILITPMEWGIEHYLGFSSQAVRAIVSVITGFAFAGFLSAILEKEYALLAKKK